MSAQTMAEAFAPWEAHYKAQVMGATWGHLAPKRNKTYKGTILFTLTEYGHYEVIRSEFKTLPDSPWFYDAQNQFICEHAQERGSVYRFDGYFRNYEFHGTVKELEL